MLVFTPISSVNKEDLMYKMAGKYVELYKSSPDLPGRLAERIEGPSGTGDPSLAATLQSMQASITSLQGEVRTLRSENVALRLENVSMRLEHAAMRSEHAAMWSEHERRVGSLEKYVETLEEDLAALNRKLGMLAAMEDVLVRKLLDECRNRCKQALATANIPLPAEDWNLVIDDPTCLALLMSLGLRRDCGLQATRCGPSAHMQQRGDKAAHVIVEDKSLYAEVVCSKAGFERQSLTEIYKFVFHSSDPEQDAFTTAAAASTGAT